MADESEVITRPPAPSLTSRVVGIITAPRATFEKIVVAPRVGGALALVALTGAITVGGFLATEVGQQAWLDQAVIQQESFGQTVDDNQYAAMQQMQPYAGYFGAAQMLFAVPLMALIMGGILFAIFNAGMGGTATFKQLMSVVAHSTIIWALGYVFTLPLNYAKGTMSSGTSLGVLFPMLDESSFAARFLGAFDLFAIWWVIVLSIGLSVLYRRKTSSIATALLVAYVLIALAIATVFTSMGGA